MMERDERDLERRFAALRESDADNAPPFATIVHRAAEGGTDSYTRGRNRGRLILGTMAAAAIVAIAVVVSMSNRASHSPVAMLDWHAASDGLLLVARPALLDEMPPLRASVLDSILP